MYDIIDLEEDGIYYVHEVFTDKIIMACGDSKTVEEFVNSLNKGSGFNGWTPEFFTLNNIVV